MRVDFQIQVTFVKFSINIIIPHQKSSATEIESTLTA